MRAEVDDPLAVGSFATQASRMFHSGGTIQSRTGVPDGTSCTSIGDMPPEDAQASRARPSPVMLRQIG